MDGMSRYECLVDALTWDWSVLTERLRSVAISPTLYMGPFSDEHQID
jgi:hypothetical protein